jgi:hypothetical protein
MNMGIGSALGQPPPSAKDFLTLDALVTNFLLSCIPYDRIPVAHFRLRAKIDHRLLPCETVTATLAAMSMIGQKVRVLVD